MKRVAVQDANIFIDLESMGVLDLWFLLGYETITSTFVVDELDAGRHTETLSYIESGQVTAMNLELDEFYGLYEELEDTGVSPTDASVLYIAIQHDAILLTGDKALRYNSEIRDIECHGSLWILTELVENNHLHPLVAAEKLRSVMTLIGGKKRFLPKAICEDLISAWTKLARKD